MQHHQMLMFFALPIFAFGLFSRLAERNSVSGPMFFMTVGILASSLGLLDVTHELGPVKLVTKLALMLVLFIDVVNSTTLFGDCRHVRDRGRCCTQIQANIVG